MAQLERAPDGLKMNELSRRMMVTGGNITGITDQLVAEGLVERVEVPGDRRAYRVRLTPKGRKQFSRHGARPRAMDCPGLRRLDRARSCHAAPLLGKVKAHPKASHTSRRLP
jgi:DNA-binding MarR family transcriptional regulator